jgi:hypothetical protein
VQLCSACVVLQTSAWVILSEQVACGYLCLHSQPVAVVTAVAVDVALLRSHGSVASLQSCHMATLLARSAQLQFVQPHQVLLWLQRLTWLHVHGWR